MHCHCCMNWAWRSLQGRDKGLHKNVPCNHWGSLVGRLRGVAPGHLALHGRRSAKCTCTASHLHAACGWTLPSRQTSKGLTQLFTTNSNYKCYNFLRVHLLYFYKPNLTKGQRNPATFSCICGILYNFITAYTGHKKLLHKAWSPSCWWSATSFL